MYRINSKLPARKLSALTCLPLLFTVLSCTKVIELKLRNAVPHYVVEGNITDQPGPYTVLLSQTDTFSASYRFRGVSSATVIIRDNAGNNETLQETAPGIYQTTLLSGIPGRTYSMEITLGDQHFTAVSTMPLPVSLDSLFIRSLDNFGKTVRAVVPVFTDPKGPGNCYRFNQTINGHLDKTLYYQNDDFTDGLPNTFALLQPDPDSTLHPHDRVDVTMECIDKPVYKYWFSLDQSANGSGSAIPANPVTNITGGALGYFSAHTEQTRSLTVE